MLSTLSGTPVLVAVSGGSDSVALLHWMLDTHPEADLHCATVDHGLREEAAQEAEQVSRLAKSLGLPHTTLTWSPPVSTTSADARQARYRLLRHFAKEIDARMIVLGHTLDDQAETVFMRALRLKPDSDTRGLSGIPEWSSHHGLRLWRPLLNRTRQEKRDDLNRRSVGWIDDPSNQDPSYERVRVRSVLNDPCKTDVPSKANIARLASLSGRTRTWINLQTSAAIRNQVSAIGDGVLLFDPDPAVPRAIAHEVLSALVLVAGGQNFRQPTHKLADIVEAARRLVPLKSTLGRCLIETKNGQITVERESRNLPEMPSQVNENTHFDGRLLLKPRKPRGSPEVLPYIEALEAFRASFDDSLHAALMELLDSPPRST